MAVVYIFKSKKLARYYTGSCLDLDLRLGQHRRKEYIASFTALADDWEVFLSFGNLEYEHARRIEAYIKRMKSKTYIENLKKYPELVEVLISRNQS